MATTRHQYSRKRIVAVGALFGLPWVLLAVAMWNTDDERADPDQQEFSEEARLYVALHNLHPDFALASRDQLLDIRSFVEPASCMSLQFLELDDEAPTQAQRHRQQLHAQCELENAVAAAVTPTFQRINATGRLPEKIHAFAITNLGRDDSWRLMGPFLAAQQCQELAESAYNAGFGVSRCRIWLTRGG